VLKQTLTYVDFDEQEQTEDFYFHLSVPDIVEMNMIYDEGIEQVLQALAVAKDGAAIMANFKKIIGMTIGKKSANGKAFLKNDEIREEFFGSPAFDVLFEKLVLDADFAAEFVKGVVPSKVREEAAKALEVAKTKSEAADLEKPAPRIISKAEFENMPRSEMADLAEKIAIGEVVVNVD
jgi:hypothetical protein